MMLQGGLLHRLPPRFSSEDSSGEKDKGLAESKEELKKRKKDKGEKKEKHEKKQKTSGSKKSGKKNKRNGEDNDDDSDPDHDPIRDHDEDDDDDHRDEAEMASQVPKDLRGSGTLSKRPAMQTQKKPAAAPRSGKRSQQEPHIETA